MIKPEFMHIDFWTRFPRKMSASKAYINRKKKEEDFRTDEERERTLLFMDLLKENGITYRMKTSRG